MLISSAPGVTVNNGVSSSGIHTYSKLTTAFITQSRFVSPKTFMCKRLHLKAVQQRPRHRHKSYVYVGGHQARAQAAGSHLLGISSVLSTQQPAARGTAWTLFVLWLNV